MAATALSSCSVNDEIQEPERAVKFTSSITAQAIPVGRAAGSDWSAGDAVGIFMVDGQGALQVNSQYNVTGAADGAFEAAGPNDELCYPQDGTTVNFIAYYPYEASYTLTTAIPVVIGDQDKQPTFDLLYAATTGGYNKDYDGSVNLRFEHRLSKLVLTCTADNNVGVALAGMTVKVKGMNTRSTFDLSDGTAGTPGTPAAITPRTLTDGAEYDAIILPDTYAANEVTVDFTISTGETFTWDVGATRFESGYEYTYEVKLSRTGVTATGSIKSWTTEDRGSVVAE